MVCTSSGHGCRSYDLECRRSPLRGGKYGKYTANGIIELFLEKWCRRECSRWGIQQHNAGSTIGRTRECGATVTEDGCKRCAVCFSADVVHIAIERLQSGAHRYALESAPKTAYECGGQEGNGDGKDAWRLQPREAQKLFPENHFISTNMVSESLLGLGKS